MQSGHPRVVSVPGGAPSDQVRDDGPSRKYGFLEMAKPLTAGIREIILAVDSDGPGAALLRDLGVRLGKARCRWAKWPVGCKDANEALETYGTRGVTESLARAAWVAVPGVYRLDQLPPHEHRESYSCGFPPLDPHFRVRMGDLSVWTGIPGHGKTTSSTSSRSAWPASTPSASRWRRLNSIRRPTTSRRSSSCTSASRPAAIAPSA
jgi:twinkle protein